MLRVLHKKERNDCGRCALFASLHPSDIQVTHNPLRCFAAFEHGSHDEV